MHSCAVSCEFLHTQSTSFHLPRETKWHQTRITIFICRNQLQRPEIAEMFRNLQTEWKTLPGIKVGLWVFAFFSRPQSITPPFAAHWSDTEPRFGSES
jgi:hypothetical protein